VSHHGEINLWLVICFAAKQERRVVGLQLRVRVGIGEERSVIESYYITKTEDGQ